jgi:hypothetical protein
MKMETKLTNKELRNLHFSCTPLNAKGALIIHDETLKSITKELLEYRRNDPQYVEHKEGNTELVVGAIYKCTDGDIRRLDRIEDRFLSYSLPIGRKGTPVRWLEQGRTYRYQCESLFINGKQIAEKELE